MNYLNKGRPITECFVTENKLEDNRNLLHAINKSNTTGKHEEITNILKNPDITLSSVITETKKLFQTMKETLGEKQVKFLKGTGRQETVTTIIPEQSVKDWPQSPSDIEKLEDKTVVRKLLEDAVNGNQIVSRYLDDFMTCTNDVPDREDFAIQIDFSGIVNFKNENPKQFRALFDIFDILKGSHSNEKDYPIITHPVIALFIWKKWEKTCFQFYGTFLAYLIFIIFYSSMVFDNFGTEYVNATTTITNCSALNDNESSTHTKVGLIVCLVLLLIWEGFQAARLGRLYIREIENYIELFVFLSAICLLIYKSKLIPDEVEVEVLRGIIAMGICLGWIELIFIAGRIRHIGGEFSMMFYNIIHRVGKYFLIICAMVLGYSFAFMVLHYCLENIKDEERIFKDVGESFMRTLTLSLGEYEFGNTSNTFSENVIRRGFLMLLLITLIIFGSLTIYNLFVAVVITDVTELRDSVFRQNMLNIGQLSFLVEESWESWSWMYWVVRKMKIKDPYLKICVHDMCRNDEKCGEKLPENMVHVREYLLERFVRPLKKKEMEMENKKRLDDKEVQTDPIYNQ